MNILHDTLKECGYAEKAPFSFTYAIGDREITHEAAAFLSEQDRNQVYLLVCVEPGELSHIVTGSFMSSLARAFRSQPYHDSPMDRNTSLLLQCSCTADSRPDHDAKVRLEDDPYYFKKYVFACTPEQEAAALGYIEGQMAARGEAFSLRDAIQQCLLDTERFAVYKSDVAREPAYAYFAELSAKLVILPIQPRSSGNIRSVQERWDAAIKDMPRADIKAMEQITKRILETKKDGKQPEWNLEEILAIWDGRTAGKEA